ncbi:hypothetical protein BJ741DRAFT_590220 [Chytriomyces cf. hyalinus JEL632]|nr:hypothetical protein BJ741DRAFT_590220 [Chytriomyces cf. hyalinus JEL632]
MNSCTGDCIDRAIALILKESGFETCDADALTAMRGLFEARLILLATRTRNYAHAMSRSSPHAADLSLSLADANVHINSLKQYAKDLKNTKRTLISAAAVPRFNHTDSVVSTSVKLFKHAEFDVSSSIEKKGVAIVAPLIQNMVPDHSDNALPVRNPDFPNDPYLPKYPSVHTYKKGEISGDRESNVAKLREIKALRAREVDSNLRRLLLASEQISNAGSGNSGNVASSSSSTKEAISASGGGSRSFSGVANGHLGLLHSSSSGGGGVGDVGVVNYRLQRLQGAAGGGN